MNVRAALLLAGAALVQLTLLGRLDPALPAPNLVLAVVVARTCVTGSESGMRWALAGGLMLDLGGMGPLGVHALAMLTAAYAAGWCAASLDRRRLVVAAVAGAVAAAFYSAVVLGAADSLGLAQVSPRAALPIAAGATAAGALFAAAAVALLARFRVSEVAAW